MNSVKNLPIWSSFRNIVFLTILILILCSAFYVRTKLLFYALPFYDDEITLVWNLQDKSFFQLFLVLDDVKVCPPLFLVFAKIVFSLFGQNELALRFIPYFSGILSIFAFCYLTFLVFKNRVSILLANLLFLYSDELNFFSFTFKQYSFDCLAAVLVLIAAIKLKDSYFSYKKIILLSTLSFLLFLFSYTSIIVVIAALFAIIIYRSVNKQKDNNIQNSELPKKESNILKVQTFLICPLGIFMVIFFYLNILPAYTNSGMLVAWINCGFENEFFVPVTAEHFNMLFGFFCPFILFVAKDNLLIIFSYLIISLVILFRKNLYLFCLFVLPFVIACILGALYIYPFSAARVSLYLLPIFLLIIAYLIDIICSHAVVEIIVGIILLLTFMNYDVVPVYEYEVFNNGERMQRYYINALDKSDIKPNDYIFVAHRKPFIYEDKQKKYQDYSQFYKIFYTKKLPDEMKNLKRGDNIFFWLENPENFLNYYNFDIEQEWIDKNCNIKYSVKDYYGTFIKCKVK